MSSDRIRYGQIVVGPPGSGKTTYCNGMQQYLNAIGRKCVVVNLDPANEYLKESKTRYDMILDVCSEIVNAGNVMDEFGLGPNGALLYCIEYLVEHFDDVLSLMFERFEKSEQENSRDDGEGAFNNNAAVYVLFDVPGQVELFAHHNFISVIVDKLQKRNIRLCSVHLIDALNCSDAYKFIGSVLLATSTMIRLELPAVNILSKMDLLKSSNIMTLPFNLSYFTDVMDLNQLLDYLDGDHEELESSSHILEDDGRTYWADDSDYKAARAKVRQGKFYQKHRKLQEHLCDCIDDFGLVSFLPLDIEDAESVGRVVAQVDKCNGYVFGLNEMKDSDAKKVSNMFKCAAQDLDGEWSFERNMSVQERYLPDFFGSNDEDKKK